MSQVCTFQLRFRAGICAAALLLGSAVTLWAQQKAAPSYPDYIQVKSKASLVHMGSLDSFDLTEGGKSAAALLLDTIEKGNMESAKKAIDIYERIIPDENFGGEYTALEWFCEYLSSTPQQQKDMLADKVVEAFYQHLSDNNYYLLKDYLKRKYHLEKFDDDGTRKARERVRFLEDFILFNNPRRERWEKTSKIMNVLDLKPGQVVVDVGSGPGHYTFKFADKVGADGYVYAVETNPQHIEYVKNLAQKLNYKNIETVMGKQDGFTVTRKADLVYLCSLYHVIYTLCTEQEREMFVNSLRSCLKPDGTLVIVDNALVEDATLPYHGPYIAKELIINQMKWYGFKLVAEDQFIPQRYVLVFKQAPIPTQPPVLTGKLPDNAILMTSRKSLVHLPGDMLPDVTKDGREAAQNVVTALTKKDLVAAKKAVDIYNRIVPIERLGDDYTALQWFCEYLLATDAQKKEMVADPYVKAYYDFLAADDFTPLRQYITYRYRLDEESDPAHPEDRPKPKAGETQEQMEKRLDAIDAQWAKMFDQLCYWRDFVLFNNPKREQWEKTSKMIDFLKIKPGQTIGDVGSGPGYYTFMFAKLVGKDGHVFAVDTNQEPLTYVADLAKKYAPNVETIKSKMNDAFLPPNSCDMVYLCSLYHMVYATSMEKVKDQFVDSLKKSLKKGGRLIIADNDIVPDGVPPYHGPHISRDLVIQQMKYYGFRLVDSAQFIPQRYVLVFELAPQP